VIAPLRDLQQLVLDPATGLRRHDDPLLTRIANALRAVRAGGEVGPADLAALLRQGTMRGGESEDAAELRVPRGSAWPDAAMWRAFMCDVAAAGDEFLIRPRVWQPSWLDPGAGDVVTAAICERSRRTLRPVPADPLVTKHAGYQAYSSAGQREAVRAAFLMPTAGTTIVALPTGAGKTLAFQLPALRFAASSELTVVIVPTVALARDQEERFRDLLQKGGTGAPAAAQPLAYDSGLPVDAKRAMATGIRDGTLPIVFVSPEAALGALRGPLFDAASHGRLRLFAIDEAHVVSQWGQQFRPEFQSIAGLRNALLAACPAHARFRTLLLTATLTVESLEALRLFFGRDCQVVSELQLRPEPGYCIAAETSEAQRKQHVLEAMRCLPRPLILYTTVREDAAEWSEYLRTAGFRRLRLVRGGDVSGSDGEKLLREWKTRAVDVVVATSAFGLGMHLPEVRAVVHACMPESIDRYYQEVGRGGRDGNAAVAMLLTTDADVQVAEAMALEPIISAERGFERWEAMFRGGRSGGDGTHVVSLDEHPPDIHESGRRNYQWNLRTLVLMARAGILEFAAHIPPVIERGVGESDENYERRRDMAITRFYREVVVHIHNNSHLVRSKWEKLVQATRATLREADRHGIELLEGLRELRRPVNELFREVYTIDELRIAPPPFAGDCPVTRARGLASVQAADPELTTLDRTSAGMSDTLRLQLRSGTDDVGRTWVSYEPATDDRDQRNLRRRIVSLLRVSVANGVVEVCLPATFLDSDDWDDLAARAPTGFVAKAELRANSPFNAQMRLPRLTLLMPQQLDVNSVTTAMQADCDGHILVFPASTRDPRHSGRLLFEVTNHFSLSDLVARLGT
jgi:ATP-dependent DNA helicase RecQ